MSVTRVGRSAAQRERQGAQHRAGGRYAKVNPCYVCGRSAGVDYQSDGRTDTGEFRDLALCLCAKCAKRGGAMPDAEALAFYRAGVHLQKKNDP